MPFDLTFMRPGADITKPHKVNAVADFTTFIDDLKDRRRCIDAAEALRRRATFVTTLRQTAAANEDDRTAKIANAKPTEKED